MKNLHSLLAAAALIVFANAAALTHAARNRQSAPTALITLTHRELHYLPQHDDSGVALHLRYTHAPLPLDCCGFDTSVNPTAPLAWRHYHRQSPRSAYVAFQLDGPAFQSALAELQKLDPNLDPAQRSRLTPIDAAPNPETLLNRYAHRTGVLILPAILAIRGGASPNTKPTVYIRHLPDLIHVPLPSSAQLRNTSPPYRVTLRYGRFLEPSIVEVQTP